MLKDSDGTADTGGMVQPQVAPAGDALSGSQVVLVVEDDADVCEVVKLSLESAGYQVVTAGDGKTGLAHARQLQPDAILLDIMMSEQDGWDALQSLRHHPGTQEIPIVVCTVLAESQLAYALGATAFLRKPLTRSALLETLGRLARSRPAPAAGRRGASGPSGIAG
jgi:CheY-like chemotaxis protein